MTTNKLDYGWFGSSQGTVTVVIHGGGPGCHTLSDFGSVIARSPDRRWLWVDLPGFGASRPLSRTVQGTEAYARILDELLAFLGLISVDILAQSLGGCVALQLALRNPRRLKRSVIVGSQPARTQNGKSAFRAEADLGDRIRDEYYGGEGPSPEKMRSLMTKLEWHDPTLLPETTVQTRYKASIGATPFATVTPQIPVDDLSSDLSEVETPTLVVWGRHDPFAAPDYAEALVNTLPRGDLAVVERAAHHPQAEHPETVTALVDAFL